jgi:hypothetical protein
MYLSERFMENNRFYKLLKSKAFKLFDSPQRKSSSSTKIEEQFNNFYFDKP